MIGIEPGRFRHRVRLRAQLAPRFAKLGPSFLRGSAAQATNLTGRNHQPPEQKTGCTGHTRTGAAGAAKPLTEIGLASGRPRRARRKTVQREAGTERETRPPGLPAAFRSYPRRYPMIDTGLIVDIIFPLKPLIWR
jgi:hypothetical protein